MASRYPHRRLGPRVAGASLRGTAVPREVGLARTVFAEKADGDDPLGAASRPTVSSRQVVATKLFGEKVPAGDGPALSETGLVGVRPSMGRSAPAMEAVRERRAADPIEGDAALQAGRVWQVGSGRSGPSRSVWAGQVQSRSVWAGQVRAGRVWAGPVSAGSGWPLETHR